jgi:hypothetical protein
MDLREIGCGRGSVEWIHLAQDRDHWWAVVNAVTNLRVLAPRGQLVKVFKKFCTDVIPLVVNDSVPTFPQQVIST